MSADSGTKALQNADRYNGYSVGMCLQWVRGPCWQLASYFGSAIEAWNGARHKHPGDRNPPDGAPCYYRGGTYGHIVIHRRHDSGRIRSTDCPSSGLVSDADLSWPETAWGFTYLGWTEDLNGVLLPLGDDDMALSDDDLERIVSGVAARVNRVLGDYNSKGEPDDVDQPQLGDQRIRQIQNVVKRIESDVK